MSVADLDPRVADALLERLASEGIPAYVAPAHDVDPLVGSTRSGQLRDRLWVDGHATDRARVVVAEATTSSDEPELDFDAAWQDVLDSLRQESKDPVARWPVSEDLDSPDGGVTSSSGKTYDEIEAERQARYEEEDHYVPPPPPPVPRLKRYTVGALVTIAIGVILLFDPLEIGDTSMLLGVLAIIGGVGALIYRMKEGPPIDSGPDDGAVV